MNVTAFSRGRLLLFIALNLNLIVAEGARADEPSTSLTDQERAVAVAARHLSKAIGTERLRAVVRSGAIRGDAYWSAVFAEAGHAAWYGLVRDDLKKALESVPLVNGERAPPDVFAKAVALTLGPLPLIPLELLPPSQQQTILTFALGPLADFQRAFAEATPLVDQKADVLARAATTAFDSAAIAADIRRLGAASLAGFASKTGRGRSPENDADLVDAKDKLNEFLHLYGLHVVLEFKPDENAPPALKCYVVREKFQYEIFHQSFVIYRVTSVAPEPEAVALGHAETEQGFLFLFDDLIQKEVDADVGFLEGRFLSGLWTGDAIGNPEPMSPLSEAAAHAIEDAVRASLPGIDAARYRRLLIDSIAHHEGFHKHIDPTLERDAHRFVRDAEETGAFHERGAYLYQLETADPAFLRMSLLMVAATALDPHSPSPLNRDGARYALADLQKQLSSIHFWNAEKRAPLSDGLAALFQLPPASVKKAAEDARWLFEAQIQTP